MSDVGSSGILIGSQIKKITKDKIDGGLQMITNIVLLWVLYNMNAPIWTFALLIVHTAFKLFKS